MVRKKVVAAYLNEPGVEYIEEGQGEEAIAGHLKTAIVILVADEATAETLAVPDEIDGIPISIEIGHIVDTE